MSGGAVRCGQVRHLECRRHSHPCLPCGDCLPLHTQQICHFILRERAAATGGTQPIAQCFFSYWRHRVLAKNCTHIQYSPIVALLQMQARLAQLCVAADASLACRKPLFALSKKKIQALLLRTQKSTAIISFVSSNLVVDGLRSIGRACPGLSKIAADVCLTCEASRHTHQWAWATALLWQSCQAQSAKRRRRAMR